MSSDKETVILVELAANYVKGSISELDKHKQIIAVKNSFLLGQILPVVEAFLRAPIENTSVAALSDSLKNLQFSNGATEKCMDLLSNLKSGSHTDTCLKQEYFHTLLNMKWRIDITISSSVLSRVFEPTIILELELSNQKKVTFEMTVSKFHKLRYTVASILKDIDQINNKMIAVKV